MSGERVADAARWLIARADEAIDRLPRLGTTSYVTDLPREGSPDDWTDRGPVPRAAQGFRPQGLAHADGHLWLTDHRRNAESYLYRLPPEGGEPSFEARMPAGAVHPGGLTVVDDRLWALDYVSTHLYAIDPDASLSRGRVVLDEYHPTGLPASSALASLTVDGARYLAVSDFLWRMQTTPPRPDGTARTYVVPYDRVPDLGTSTVPELAVLSYDNGGFSQGLVWDGEHLLEARNNVGIDRVEVLDVADAIRQRNPSLVERRASLHAPGPMVEDLATDGQRLWTTDEGTFNLYERALDS